MDDEKTTIGQVIQEFRKKRDMTMSQLGDASKVSKGIISRMERGQLRNPNLKTIVSIAEAMSTRASALLRRLEELKA